MFIAKVTGIGSGVLTEDVPNNFLPYIPKEHNWVCLAQRFPVQLEFDNISSQYPLRKGASAIVVIFTGTNAFWNNLAYFCIWVQSVFQYLT